MSVGRHSVKIEVSGAEKAAGQLGSVSDAEDKVGESGHKGKVGLDSLQETLKKFTGPAGEALKVLNGIGAGFKIMAGFAGGALPGALGDIAESFKKIWTEATIALTSMDDLAGQGIRVKESMLTAKLGVDDLSDGIDRYAKKLGVANGEMLTFLERKRGVAAIASGEVKDVNVEEKKTEILFDKIQQLEAQLRRGVEARRLAEAIGTGSRGRPMMSDAQIAKMGEDIQLLKMDMLEQDALARQMKRPGPTPVEQWLARTFSPPVVEETPTTPTTPRTPRTKRIKPPVEDVPIKTVDIAPVSIADARRAIASVYDSVVSSIDGPIGVLAESLDDLYDTVFEKQRGFFDAQSHMADGFNGTFRGMAAEASNASEIMVAAIGTITGSIGSMMTNLLVAGDANSKNIKKMAGNALAGISAQAFGYAVLLEAFAVAAYFAPGLNWSAPGLAIAGGIMAAAGTALAVSARALGADKIGGKSSSGNSSSGSGAKSGGGGEGRLSPAPPHQSQPQNITVLIGGEEVHAVVVRENDRVIHSGSMARRSFAT